MLPIYAEIKHSDLMLQVTRLFLTNPSVLFQHNSPTPFQKGSESRYSRIRVVQFRERDSNPRPNLRTLVNQVVKRELIR